MLETCACKGYIGDDQSGLNSNKCLGVLLQNVPTQRFSTNFNRMGIVGKRKALKKTIINAQYLLSFEQTCSDSILYTELHQTTP